MTSHAPVEQCVFRKLHRYLLQNRFSPSSRGRRDCRDLTRNLQLGKSKKRRQLGSVPFPAKPLASPCFVCAAVRRAFPFFCEGQADGCLRDYKGLFAHSISRDHLRILDSSLESRDVGWSSTPASLFPRLSLPPLCLPPLPAATAERGTACAKNDDPQAELPKHCQSLNPAQLPASLPLIYVSLQCYLSTAP